MFKKWDGSMIPTEEYCNEKLDGSDQDMGELEEMKKTNENLVSAMSKLLVFLEKEGLVIDTDIEEILSECW